VLDVLGIFVSGVMMMFVIIRAVQLDRARPWFEAPAAETAPDAAESRPGRSPMRPGQVRPVRSRAARR
jgi:hypothetical protein